MIKTLNDRTLLDALLSMAWASCANDHALEETPINEASRRQSVQRLCDLVAHVDLGDLGKPLDRFEAVGDGLAQEAVRAIKDNDQRMWHECERCRYRNLLDDWPADKTCPVCGPKRGAS